MSSSRRRTVNRLKANQQRNRRVQLLNYRKGTKLENTTVDSSKK